MTPAQTHLIENGLRDLREVYEKLESLLVPIDVINTLKEGIEKFEFLCQAEIILENWQGMNRKKTTIESDVAQDWGLPCRCHFYLRPSNVLSIEWCPEHAVVTMDKAIQAEAKWREEVKRN